VQLGGGHRQRQYCDDTCKQRAYLDRCARSASQARKATLRATYPAFAEETIDLLDGFEAMGNHEMVERIAAVICAELERRPLTSIADALMELGEQLNYCKLDFATPSWKVPAVLWPGRDSWQRFAERAPALDVKGAYESAMRAVASNRQ